MSTRGSRTWMTDNGQHLIQMSIFNLDSQHGSVFTLSMIQCKECTTCHEFTLEDKCLFLSLSYVGTILMMADFHCYTSNARDAVSYLFTIVFFSPKKCINTAERSVGLVSLGMVHSLLFMSLPLGGDHFRNKLSILNGWDVS